MTDREPLDTYMARKWDILPISLGEKAPDIPGWLKRHFTASDFPDEFNIGVKLGDPSGGLVDVDIDALDALPLADEYLPATDSIFGRESKCRSHWLYYAEPGQRTRRWTDAQGKVIVEIRANGSQTIFPGSMHPSGEMIEWDFDERPTKIEFSKLVDACEALARAVREQRGEPPAEPRVSVPVPSPAPQGGTPGAVAVNAAAMGLLHHRARKYISTVAPTAEGGRNNAAFRIAGHVAAFREKGHRLGEFEVFGLLRNWNDRNNPPLSDDELAKCVASAFRNGTPRAEKPGQVETPPGPKPKLIDPFTPFPTDVLPAPLDRFVVEGARAIGCDPVYVILPMLSAMASAIGNTRRIELKRSWTEPAVIWTAIVGDSGTLKSPALELALGAIRKRQKKAIKEHAKDMEKYALEALRHKMAMAAWEKDGGEGDPPEAPKIPILSRTWGDDMTMEALANLLYENWRGILVVKDELAGWLGSFDRYSQGKGGDAPKWLEFFGARPVFIDRKTGNPRRLYIPRAAVSIAGGIQPGTLQNVLERQYFENGLAARLLLACPPRRAKRWSEAVIPKDVEQAVIMIFDRLFSLMPTTGMDGEPEPGIVRLSPQAKATWISFYNDHAKEHAGMTGDISALWSKLEGGAARLALVIHCVRWAAGDPKIAQADIVDEHSIAAGVAISNWFGKETRRVYAILSESDVDRQRRNLAELIQRHGGSMTARDLMRCSREYRTAGDAELALLSLTRAGWGEWVSVNPTDHGGRPTCRFVLTQQVDADTTPPNPENNEVVSTETSEDPVAEEEGEGETFDLESADTTSAIPSMTNYLPDDSTQSLMRRRTLDPDQPGPLDLLSKEQVAIYQADYHSPNTRNMPSHERHARAWRKAITGGKE